MKYGTNEWHEYIHILKAVHSCMWFAVVGHQIERALSRAHFGGAVCLNADAYSALTFTADARPL